MRILVTAYQAVCSAVKPAGAVLCLMTTTAIFGACGGESPSDTAVVASVSKHAAQALTVDGATAAFEAIDGTYGSQCSARSGYWSVPIGSYAGPLAHDALSVVKNNGADCVLSVTSVQVNGSTYQADASFPLSSSFGTSPARFATMNAPFYVNFDITPDDFSSDFAIEMQVADDAAQATAAVAAAAVTNTVHVLAVGDTIVDRPSHAPTIEIENTSGSTAQYLIIPMNLTMGSAYPLTISGSNLAPLSGVLPSAGTRPTADQHSATRDAGQSEYVARVGTTGSGTAVSPASSVPQGVPAVGDAWSLNAELVTQCTSGTARSGTVQYVGTHSIVVSDNANPAGGLAQSDYSTLGSNFDTQIYPSITTIYGAPSDKDNNGRVVLFFTSAVNAYVANGDSAYAHFRTRDLLSQSECPTSNVGEMIYVMAADPTGTINSRVVTTSSVKGSAPVAIAHALGHLVVDSRRAAAASPFEERWLDEGLAGLGVDRIFTDNSGLGTLRNIVVSNITSGPSASSKVSFFNSYANSNFTNWRGWLQAPAQTGFLDTMSSPATRGAAWSFVRYAADRAAAGNQTNEIAFLHQVANSTTTGLANLAAEIGGPADLWMRDYLASVYIDDTGIAGLDVSTLPYQSTTWNYRSLYAALGSWPLQLPVLASSGAPASISLAPGGANYIQFAIASQGQSTITLTPPTGTTWDAWYMILRRL